MIIDYQETAEIINNKYEIIKGLFLEDNEAVVDCP